MSRKILLDPSSKAHYYTGIGILVFNLLGIPLSVNLEVPFLTVTHIILASVIGACLYFHDYRKS